MYKHSSDYVTLGRHFILGFLEGGGEAHIYVSTQSAFPVWVNVSSPSFPLERFTVKSNTYISLPLPQSVNFVGHGKQLSVVSVDAESPVSVYGVTKTGNSLGDGFTAIPVHNLGTEYYIGTYIPNIGGSPDVKDRLSQIAVIASQDSTTVRVHTSKSITNINLAKNEAYQIQEDADQTGAFITSNHPIAVFAGVACTNVPSGKNDCQYLVEQIPDITTLGRQYLVAPSLDDDSGQSSYVIRVVATTPNTTIDILGSSSLSRVLQTKEYEEYVELGANTTLIIADKPVLVIQYTTSYNTLGTSMTVIPSIQMYHDDVDFFVPQSDNQNYVSITARCSDGPNLLLTNTHDDVANDTQLEILWDRQYTRDQMCVYQKWIPDPGTYRVSVNESISARFFVLVNGRSIVSYALPVAFQKEGDACSSNPCLNGATCFNRQSRYDFLCLCQPGWEGRNCHRAIPPHVCKDVVCRNAGRCFALDDEEESDEDYVCLCQYGWGGKDCSQDVVNECTSSPCSNGRCIDEIGGGYTCLCTEGFMGELCDISRHPDGIAHSSTEDVIVVAGVIVGCLCLIAVIINVAFITRERCSMRRRRHRRRHQPIEEFRNNGSMRRRQQQQLDEQPGDQRGEGHENDRRRSRQESEEQQRPGETNERRHSRRENEDQQQVNERRRSQRENQDQRRQSGTNERRSNRPQSGDQQQTSERRHSQRQNNDQPRTQSKGSDRRRSGHGGSSRRQNETQQPDDGNVNPAFNDEET